MDEVRTALQHRFPLLTSLRLFDTSGDSEDLAAFMGVLLSTMTGRNDTSFCFVVPRKTGVAPLSAVLYALGRFAVDFPALAEEYARTGFEEGQNVRLVPGDKVFVFGGVWRGIDTFFRLKLLDDKHRTSFTWPVSDILRIEPTTYKRPKGREADIAAARTKPPLSRLDRLIGTRTCGNPSLAVNQVLYLGGRAEMEDFFANTTLGTAMERASLADLIVPGDVTASGAICHQDEHQAAGEPLIAISSRIDHIAAACIAAPAHSKVVVVDGAKRISDLASFDRIAESQNLIIVAETDEEEKLRQFHDRGCRLWRFSLSDLAIGNESCRHGFFRDVFQSAHNEAALHVDSIVCRNADLEETASALEDCQEALEESEGDETQRVLRQIYGLLLRCAGFVQPPEAADRTALLETAALLSADAEDRMMWLPESVAGPLQASCRAITRAIEGANLGTAKGDAARTLLLEIQKQSAGPLALVARTSFAKQYLMNWLGSQHLNVPVILGAGISANDFYERLICISWPNAANFRRLVRRFAAPHATLLGYPFEAGWLHNFTQREHRFAPLPYLTATDKSVILGLSATASWPVSEPASNGYPVLPPPSGFDFEERITRKGVIPADATGEDTTPATLVGFVGDAYALLTENYKAPVITDLLSGNMKAPAKIPRRRVAELRVGDVLVFRERGRRDVIQALADAELGSKAPAIRERAARWHAALRQSGLSEERLFAELKQVNHPRTLQTVRAWLDDDSIIGPQSKADLEGIAYAVGDQHLLEDVPAIWDAIHLLRGEHLSAGMRLSRILLEKLPEKLSEIGEGRTRIDIDTTTSAWIVQVESIASTPELRPGSYVNALLWDSDNPEGIDSWPG